MGEFKEFKAPDPEIKQTFMNHDTGEKFDFVCPVGKTLDDFKDLFVLQYRRVFFMYALYLLIAGIYFYFTLQTKRIANPIIVAAFLAIEIAVILIERPQAKRAHDRMVYAQGGVERVATAYFGDDIKVDSENVETPVVCKYEDVKKLYKTGKQFILIMKYKTYINVPQDIAGASGESFESYLLSKAENAKPKRAVDLRIYKALTFVCLALTAALDAASFIAALS